MRDRAGKKCFSCAGRSYQQDASRNFRSDLHILFGVFQEINHFLHLLFCFFETGNVLEGYFLFGGICSKKFGAGFGEIECLSDSGSCLSKHHKEKKQEKKDGRNEKRKRPKP